MRATVNFEFASEELERFASNALSKGIVQAIGSLEPSQMRTMLGGMHEWLGMVLSQVRGAARPVAYAGPVGGAPPVGYGAPPDFRAPWGSPHRVPGMAMYESVAQARAGGSNVQPLNEPPTLERCLPIEETRHMEAGWGCCHCATYNGTQRPVCRHCGHPRCSVIVPPAPAASVAAAAKVSEDQAVHILDSNLPGTYLCGETVAIGKRGSASGDSATCVGCINRATEPAP